MTNLFVQREQYKPERIDVLHGVMFLNGEFFSFTMENYSKRVAAGKYKCEIYHSPTKGGVILLKDVPNRSYIEIHIANWPRELEGCIAPGDGRLNDQVMSSRTAFTRLMSVVESDISITIVDYVN